MGRGRGGNIERQQESEGGEAGHGCVGGAFLRLVRLGKRLEKHHEREAGLWLTAKPLLPHV